MENTQKKRVEVRLDKNLFENFAKLAEKNNRTVPNTLVYLAILGTEEYHEQRKRQIQQTITYNQKLLAEMQ